MTLGVGTLNAGALHETVPPWKGWVPVGFWMLVIAIALVWFAVAFFIVMAEVRRMGRWLEVREEGGNQEPFHSWLPGKAFQTLGDEVNGLLGDSDRG